MVSSKKANNLFINLLLMQERFYFGDQVLPLFVTGIPLLKQRLLQLPESDKVCSTRMLIIPVKYGLVSDHCDGYFGIDVTVTLLLL